MNTQPTRRRRGAPRPDLAVGVAVAALVATLGAGQALAGPDERILERQGMIDYHAAASQADKQGKADEPSRGSPAQPRGGTSGPSRPWIPVPGSTPTSSSSRPAAAAGQRPDGLVISLTVAALLLAAIAATTWRIHHHRPRPEPTT